MKKILFLFIAFLIGAVSFANSPITIDEKLIQSFKLAFPNAREVSWYESRETYLVHFEENGIKTRISYWKNGLYVQFLRYYLERDLPSYIQYRLKKEYPGKTISSITELSTIAGSKKVMKVEYNIKMQDETDWITVRLDAEGYMQIVEKFRKA